LGVSEELLQQEAATLGLANLFAPAIRAGRAQLTTGLMLLQTQHSPLPGDVATLERLLFEQFLPVLQSMVGATLVLELNVARLQGTLIGETPQQRYDDFVRSLRTPDVARAILDEYPVLARQVLLAIDQWVRFGLEFIGQLCADWNLLCETLELRNDDMLMELTGGAGDRHADGRCVLLLRFSSGTRLVYKPKSLAAEVRFQKLLQWCNERGATPALRTLQIVDRGDHSWVEYIDQATCKSRDEVRRFYERQGAYLALLYVVAATDLHFENLVAAGEHPMFIDLEALFHQRPHRQEIDPAAQALTESVLAIRLLPQTAYVEGIDQPVDFSGLGATAGQTLPYLAARLQAAHTDDMRIALEHAELPPGHHLPTLYGEPVDLREHGGDLLTGFKRMYELLTAHRNELLAADGPFARFAKVEVRHIARITQIYSILRDMSQHPDRLRDALDRDRWLDRLWAQARDFPTLARLIAAERADLYRNDIPLFTTRPGSRDLFSSTGERIENYFEQSSFDLMRGRITNLGSDDLARQTWLIQATLAILPTNNSPAAAPLPHLETQNASESLAAALAIGEQLASLAWQTDDQAGWLGCVKHPRGWTLGALGLDLATGLPGVVLFLAELGALGGENRFLTLAGKALNTICRKLAANAATSRSELRELIAVLAYLPSVVGDAKFVRAAHRTADIARSLLAQTAGDGAEAKASGGVDAASVPPSGICNPGLRDGLAGPGRSMLHAAIQTQLMEELLPS
jgi:type 2 lantibiotic biosynthesis protein LanM